MSQASIAGGAHHARRSMSFATLATIVAYTVLAVVLCVTRLADLGHSFWHDEIHTVAEVIRPGPGQIFAGPELNHELFSIIAWANRYVFGESEIAYRLWSVVPFLIGAAVVTAWLHVRVTALAGILFLYLATISPLLLDITRQARGYGLAFLAMGVMVVAALEADRNRHTWAVATFCVAGVLGTWTLPQFGIAFVATGVMLLSNHDIQRRLATGLALSLIAIGLWYAPHVNELHAVSQDSGRVQIHSTWVVTAPIDQIVVPALVWIDGIALVAGFLWLPIVLALVALMASSPLARDRRVVLLLSMGAVATVVVLWVAQTYVIPRYLSFLLVPLFVLLASGMAAVLAHLRDRPMIFRTLASFVALGVLGVRFVSIAPDVVRLPREAHRDAAAIVERSLPADAPVLAYLHNPTDLVYYLGRPVLVLRARDVARKVCGNSQTVAYVMQPFALQPVAVPCLRRSDVTHYRFRQYTRGGSMNVWFVPPSS